MAVGQRGERHRPVGDRDGSATAPGRLTVGETAVRLAVPVQITADGEGELRLRAATTISRAAVGVAWNKLGVVDDDTTIDVALRFVPVD